MYQKHLSQARTTEEWESHRQLMEQCTKTVEGVNVWKGSQFLCTQAAKEETVLHKESINWKIC